jgi:hypothetical protein
MRRVARPDWSRPLPRSLVIPDVMTLVTLADVRTLIGHLPAERRARSTWRYVEAQLAEAAKGALDTRDVAAALAIAFSIEGVTCHPK